MEFVHDFLYKKLFLFVLGCWSYVSIYLLPLFRHLTRFSRFLEGSMVVEAIEESLKITEPNREMIEKQDFVEFSDMENDGFGEKFSFTFKFPTFEEFVKSNRDFSHLLQLGKPSPIAEKNYGEFNEKPEAEEFVVSEVDTDSNCWDVSDKDQKQDELEEEEATHEKMFGNSNEKVMEKVDETEGIDTFMQEKFQNFHHESVSSSNDSDTDSMVSNNFHSATVHLVDSYADDGFLSECNFEGEFDEKDEEGNDWANSKFLSEKDFDKKSRNIRDSGAKNMENFSNDTTNKLESLWEHQELIEQLKMEIKKVRATGLPTIFEESESPPKMMEELKPWKIEEGYQHGDHKMGEVHKFYKTYRERMRKFDIFNYQKMYAIGFLQLKDPIQSISSSKTSVPEITTLIGQSFSGSKGKKGKNDPTRMFIKELESDLEVVYVGQMCLSWEILHWQYEKALDIWESDPRGVHRFNEVADEFQQFQVLLQRFIEDEPFQGPRVHNYVKNRCVFRNLLQVPVIREDSSKKRMKTISESGGYDVSSDMLVEILEESIRIFWRFVRADKDKQHTPMEFQKPEDLQLLMEVQKDLHKKERRLKERMRSRKRMLRRLRRCEEEEEEEEEVYFFSEVDMKLVGRVLNMSRLTSDQLIWCHNKLTKITFLNNKIHVQPSFLLFPC